MARKWGLDGPHLNGYNFMVTLKIEIASHAGPYRHHSDKSIKNDVIPAVGDYIVLNEIAYLVKSRYFDIDNETVLIRCIER